MASISRRIEGAGILIHYKHYIIVGLGGRHIKDKFGSFINPKTGSKFVLSGYDKHSKPLCEELSNLQTYSESSSFDDAKAHFSKIADELSKANNQPIQYSTPVIIDGKYKTRFLFIDPEESKWGIPKGGAYKGETAEETAIRETDEEIGIRLSTSLFTPLLNKDGAQVIKNKYAIFIATIENPAAIPVLKKLTEDRQQKHYGELFNVLPVSIEKLLAMSETNDLNPITVAAVKAFAAQIGVPIPPSATPKTRRRKRSTRKNEGWRKRF